MRKAGISRHGKWEGLYSETIFGVDHYPDYWFVGMVRITLAGIDHPALELGEVLSRPKIKNSSREGFDCILAVPPWRSLDQGSRSASFDIQTKSGEGLFIQHRRLSLRPGGRAAVALPASFLFSAGSESGFGRCCSKNSASTASLACRQICSKPYIDGIGSACFPS